MTTARATASIGARERRDARSRLLGVAATLASPLLLLGVALLLLFLPVYIHPALDAAGSADLLGIDREQAHALSDRTVMELWLGPATFAFAGPEGERFYDAAEAAHLRDVRLVLFGFLGAGLLAGLVVVAGLLRPADRPAAWRAVGRGGGLLAAGVVLVGLLGVLAFERLFELFHRIFFQGGNWSFDPASQRLVQLYPLAFWQLTSAALGLLAAALGVATWLLARRQAALLESRREQSHAARNGGS